MDVEAITNVNADTGTKEALRYQPQQDYSRSYAEVQQPTDGVQTATAQAVTGKSDAKAGEDKNEDPGKKERERIASEASIKEAANRANRSMERTRCEYSYHKETNRVSIKVIDKDTDKVIREIPPEKSLDMLQKMWEMAGILVDEKR